jgi:ParB-like chromosome segregation protein Spo0J
MLNTIYPAHPVASIFPLMSASEYDSLLADIRENGLIEPIWIYQGQIIDGRNRDRACREIGFEPTVREWNGVGSLVSFVVSLNLKRRHLDPSQLAMVGVDVLPMLEAEARERQRAGLNQYSSLREIIPEGSTGKASEQAAKIVGANPRYVSDAKSITAKAPEIATHVRAGRVSIPEAKVLVNAEPETRAAIVERIEKGEDVDVRREDEERRKKFAKLKAEHPHLNETPAERELSKQRILRVISLTDALRTISELPSPEQMMTEIRPTDDEFLEKLGTVIDYLTEFEYLWSTDRGK